MKMKFLFLFLILLLVPCLGFTIQKADSVLVKKTEAKLHLIKDDVIFESFNVVFGANPQGHKKEQGDNRTPEGSYILEYKLENSAFYKAIRISYPNAADIACAKARGVNPGGRIMIHGQPNAYGHISHILQRSNWTNGCIAVTNAEMDIIWEAVDEGTPITILP